MDIKITLIGKTMVPHSARVLKLSKGGPSSDSLPVEGSHRDGKRLGGRQSSDGALPSGRMAVERKT